MIPKTRHEVCLQNLQMKAHINCAINTKTYDAILSVLVPYRVTNYNPRNHGFAEIFRRNFSLICDLVLYLQTYNDLAHKTRFYEPCRLFTQF